jgi:outer membrane receptor for ferrienterochelin and colicin
MLRLRLQFLFTILLLSPAILTAQTTGSLVGRATDESGGTLPGVTVEAKSPALQGSRVATTDGAGRYRLTLLPPGVYSVSFTLPGFAVDSKAGVTVGLAKESTLDTILRPAAREAIVVTGEAPVVDTTSSGLGTNLTTRAIESLPTGRNYSSITQVVPGISSDADPRNPQQGTITVYGSSGAENSFYIDGVNTTGIEYGFQGKELNYEFIQEIDVKTGGYEAEFGRSTGGIINVITKSGSNEFHGDVFGYLDRNSLRASAKPVVSSGGTVEGFQKEDYGADLGGPIWRDRIWFFAAYDRVHNTTDSAFEVPSGPRAGEIIKSQSISTRNLASGKLTFHVSDSHSVIATFFQDPRVDTGAATDPDHSLNGDPLTYDGRVDLGGRDYAVRYEGIFGARLTATAQAARHEERNSVGPATSAGDVVQYQDAENGGFQTGGFGLIQKKSFKRTFYGGSLAPYFGNHEVKFGIEYEKAEAQVVKRESGGQLVTKFANAVNPSKPIYEHFYWTTPTATVDNAPLSQLNASPEHKNLTLYLQDKWAVLPNLTINAGIRWDRQQIVDASGTKQVDLKHDWAPRLGFIWDPTRDHKSKVFASYGRFYEELPMDLVIRSFSFERQPRIINYDPVDNHPNPAAESDHGTASAILGGFTEPSDPNIHGQYITEFIVGGEREVLPDIAVGIKGIYRDYGNVIEDFLCINDGTYCIGNPGKGGPGQSPSGFFPGFTQVYALDYEHLFPAPRPVRIYRGVQLDVTKRFSHNWQALASYIYSKLEGNFDGEYSPFTQTTLADPNISAAYDYYDFFTNGIDLTKITNRGPLSNDRRHQFKVSGVYITPFKLSIGLAAYYRTGTPLTRYGFSDAYSRYEFFLTQRGAEGRTPDNYEADLHFGYPISVGPVSINLLLDVFSILNAQRAVVLDERWSRPQESDNASPTPLNPTYKQPVYRTAPTTARLGVRVSF